TARADPWPQRNVRRARNKVAEPGRLVRSRPANNCDSRSVSCGDGRHAPKRPPPEEAIAEVAQSGGTSPPARVYASLLGAYARRRRGDLDRAADDGRRSPRAVLDL